MAGSLKHKFGKSIYDMELDEELVADPVTELIGKNTFECLPIRILRVPGGWIYYVPYVNNNGTFVAFDNEFME